jgi:hypothetical protein
MFNTNTFQVISHRVSTEIFFPHPINLLIKKKIHTLFTCFFFKKKEFDFLKNQVLLKIGNIFNMSSRAYILQAQILLCIKLLKLLKLLKLFILYKI